MRINTGARLPLLTALFLVALSAQTAQAQFRLVGQSQEMDAGRQADAQIRAKYRISSDSYYNGMVSHIGRRLVAVCDRTDIPWTFRVIDSSDINAFSVPGYVYVNTGLLQSVGNDQDMLAGVIAHEIGHTCGRHAAKQMEKGAIGGLLVSLIGGRNKSVSALANVAENLVMLGYSRGDENDADKRAVRYTIKAGYDPNGLVRFFEMLQSKEGNGGGGLMSYFRTHPPTGDRINRVRDEIARQGGDTTSRAHRTYYNDNNRYRNDNYYNRNRYPDTYRYPENDRYYPERSLQSRE